MAVTQINTYLYVGLAGDTKPPNAPQEAKFISTDSVGVWIKGPAGWIQLPAATAVAITI